MGYLWVRFLDDDSHWRMTSLCCLFVAYFFYYYWPFFMLVSLDLQVLESDANDIFATTELWRSFLNLGIYRKPTGCLVVSSPLNIHTFF